MTGRTPVRDLTPLFDPRAVAVVGASNDASKYGNWISAQALRMRGERDVYLVNRRGETILGESAYAKLADLPGPVDLAVVTVPAGGFEDALTDALAAGARAIIGITAGFAELGPEGRAREAAIVERVRAAGAVLLGPNCLGVLDSAAKVYLTSDPLPAGRVGLISQSGNIALELGRLLEQRDLGFSRFASLGNQADLTVADLVRGYTDHDETDAIAIYCEDFGDGREFCRAAAGAVEAGKPVVLLTVGGSEASMRGAASHTGALASNSAVVDAACRTAGVDRVSSPREMADLLTMLHTFGRAPARRLAVLADGGGHAVVASDVAETEGLVVPRFGATLSAALRAELGPSAGAANPIDLAGAGLRDMGTFPAVLRLLLNDPGSDAVLLTGNFGNYGEALRSREVTTARDMAAEVRRHGKPVAVHTLGADSAPAEELRRGGVPVFSAVEDAARALALLARHATHARPHVPSFPAPTDPVTDDSYWTARELLRRAGLRFPAARRADAVDDALAAAREIGYPVVVKALGLVHKSDAGGVALALRDEDAVRAALDDMTGRLAPPGFCVEAMVQDRDGLELIVGVRDGARFGPVAMVGLGGVLTEVFRDIALALAPIDESTAREMLLSLRAAPLLLGTRGRRSVDVAAAAQAIATFTQVVAAHPEIAECEVNPLLVTPHGYIGLDARIVAHTAEPTAGTAVEQEPPDRAD